jgi:hypothetical protein
MSVQTPGYGIGGHGGAISEAAKFKRSLTRHVGALGTFQTLGHRVKVRGSGIAFSHRMMKQG